MSVNTTATGSDNHWCVLSGESLLKRPSSTSRRTARSKSVKSSYTAQVKPSASLHLHNMECDIRLQGTGLGPTGESTTKIASKDADSSMLHQNIASLHPPFKTRLAFSKENFEIDNGQALAYLDREDHQDNLYPKLRSNRRDSLNRRINTKRSIESDHHTSGLYISAYSQPPLLRHSSEARLYNNGAHCSFSIMDLSSNTLPWRVSKNNSYSYKHHCVNPEITGSALPSIDEGCDALGQPSSLRTQTLNLTTGSISYLRTHSRYTDKRTTPGITLSDKARKTAGYPDPLIDGPPKYRKRLAELFALVSDTIRNERDGRYRKDSVTSTHNITKSIFY